MIQIKKTSDIAQRRFISLVVGPSGVGKTSLARTLPEPHENILIISAEAGLLCLKGTDIDVAEVDPSSPSKSLETIYEALQTKEFKAKYKYVFIDSLTEIAQLIVAELKRDPHWGNAKNALAMWGKFNDIMTMIIKSYRDMPDYSVIFTCLSAQDKDGLEMVDVFNLPGSQLKSNLKAFFDLVLHYNIFVDEEGNKHRKLITDAAESVLAKDRSGSLEAYEEADLSVIINKVLG